MKKNILTVSGRLLCAVLGLTLLPACEDLLHLEPMEPADITVPELIKRMSKATDPEKRYHDCKSYLMKQSFSVMQSGAKEMLSIETRFQAPDKMRITTYKDRHPSVIQIYNAGKAWTYDCTTRKTTPIPPGIPSELIRIFTQMGTPSLDATKIFKTVSIDMQIENGYKTYRLICDPGIRGIAPYVFYINSRTYLTERMETIMYINGEEYLYVNIPADYTWYENKTIRLPATSTVKQMDVTRISRMTEFTINQEFPASDFLPPVPFSHRQIPAPEEKKEVKPAAGQKAAAKPATEQKKEAKP
ncbi:MAG: hypothetical protein J5806_13865 [Lentisphaeria bacterium]|nr:hypothetical protein [Lentisphaeria bacterium]